MEVHGWFAILSARMHGWFALLSARIGAKNDDTSMTPRIVALSRQNAMTRAGGSM